MSKNKWVSSLSFLLVASVLTLLFQNCGNPFMLAQLEQREWNSSNIQNAINSNFKLQKPRIRLLNSDEYRNSVNDLLGIQVSEGIEFGIPTEGYSTQSAEKLDRNTFSSLYNEAIKVTDNYVSNNITQRYSCFTSTANDTCVKNIVKSLTHKAYRKPVADSEVKILTDFFQSVKTLTGDQAQAMSYTVARIILSPNFIYRTELGESPIASDVRVMTDFEKASFISYTLTGTMPDEALMFDAKKGLLSSVNIRKHVRRLLNSPKGKSQITKFFKQWLRVTSLNDMAKHPEEYPKFSGAAQAKSLKQEFEKYIDFVLYQSDGSLPTLLSSNVGFVNRHTASLYGLTSNSEELTQVNLDAKTRKGIITLASVMAVHSAVADKDTDRPVIRGLLIKNNFLCGEVGLPSGADVASFIDSISTDHPDYDSYTVREQTDILMEQGSDCIGCHKQFMPYGYLLANYNALGEYKEDFKGRSIDSSVDSLMVSGRLANYLGFGDFSKALIDSDVTSECFAANILKFADGNQNGRHIDFLSSRMVEGFRRSNFNIKKLIEDIMVLPEMYVKQGAL